MTQPVRVDLCCNDPDNGLFDGRVASVSISEFADFEPLGWAGAKLVETPTGIHMAGKNWPTIASKEWVGNWCWNAYWMELEVATDFVCWLHGRHLYSIDMAESRVFNIWNAKERFDADDRKLINRPLAKSVLRGASASPSTPKEA